MPPIPLSSLSEADQTRLKTRNSYRRALQTILDTICNAQTENLDPSVCEQAGIHRQPLSLDEDSQWAPLFFHRYQEALGDLSEPDETPIEYDPKHEDHDNVRSLHHFMDDYINDHHPKGVPGSWVSS